MSGVIIPSELSCTSPSYSGCLLLHNRSPQNVVAWSSYDFIYLSLFMWVQNWEGLGQAGLTWSLHAVVTRLWAGAGREQAVGQEEPGANSTALFLPEVWGALCPLLGLPHSEYSDCLHGWVFQNTGCKLKYLLWPSFKSHRCYFHHTLLNWSIRLGWGCRPYLSMETC